MQIIRDINSPKLATKEGYVATIGTYDGIHLGHKAILERIKKQAHKLKIPSLLITFEPQPLEFFLGQRSNSRLTILREKLAILKELSIDKILCLRFNTTLANMHAKQFIEKLLIKKLKIKHMVVGDNFAFGRNCSGGFEMLQQYQEFKTEQVPGLQIKGIRVSSTIIRQALAMGDFSTANKFLDREYSMSGHINHGNRLGHMLGYPTANIQLRHKILPLTGVFICKVFLENQKFYGIANIGTRPTVDGSHNILEVHILNFSKEIYGKKITVNFLRKIREETKFTSLDKLRQQIKIDVEKADEYTKNY